MDTGYASKFLMRNINKGVLASIKFYFIRVHNTGSDTHYFVFYMFTERGFWELFSTRPDQDSAGGVTRN